MPHIIKDSFLICFTPINLVSGFSSSGIFPYKSDIFQECDFASCFVTDRPTPVPSVSDNPQVPSSSIDQYDNPVPGPSGLQACFVNNSSSFSPQDVRPFPKAGPRKETMRGRTKRCAILTDTPYKTALEKEKRSRESKKKQSTKTCKEGEITNVKRKKFVGVKRKLQYCDSSSSEEEEETYCLNCGEIYKNEEWVQCLKCKLWSHWACANKDAFYVCCDCISHDNNSYSFYQLFSLR